MFVSASSLFFRTCLRVATFAAITLLPAVAALSQDQQSASTAQTYAPTTAPQPAPFVPPPQQPMVPPPALKKSEPPAPMKLIHPVHPNPPPPASADAGQSSQSSQSRAKPDPSLPLPEMVANPDGSGNMLLAHAHESFSEITLKDTVLTADAPLLGSRSENADFTRELWQVKWRPNDPIDLYIIRPRGVKSPPVVVYLYSFPSETDRFKDDRFCKRVVQNGAAAVGFVSALTGQRYNYRPFKNWFISELPESLSTTAHDVQMILNFLATQGNLDMNRVGMFGQGSGGAIAVLAAASDPRIKAVDLLDPWGAWPEWFAKSDSFPEEQRAMYLKPEFLNKLEPLDPVKYLPTLKDRGVRLLFVGDSLEPELAVKKLESAAPATATIRHYPSGREMYAATSNGRLFEWIAEALKSPAGSKASTESRATQPRGQ